MLYPLSYGGLRCALDSLTPEEVIKGADGFSVHLAGLVQPGAMTSAP
jgi:hypothetical protein